MDHNQTDIGRTAALSPPTLDASNDRLLTVRELAVVLRVHEGSVRRLVSMGKLPALRVGRALRFRLPDVIRAMEGHVDG